MKLNVSIVGCGDMGRQHAKGWQARDDVRIAAVCDADEARRNALAESTGAKPYASYREAILEEGVNVVSVCVPVCYHPEVAVFAAQHGRHVLCEKPIALTIEQANYMIRVAHENGVLLSTSLQYRGFTKYLKCRQLFREGAFGGPVFARFTDVREVRPKLAMHRRSMNGGPVVDMACHFFDLMRFITGEEPVSVSARGHVFGQGKERLTGIDDLAIDAADVQVNMHGGHVLNAFVNWGMPEGYPGFGGEVIIGPALSLRSVPEGIEIASKSGKEILELDANPPGSSVRINDLADAIQEGRRPEVTGEDGRAALRMSLAALESIRIGETVKL